PEAAMVSGLGLHTVAWVDGPPHGLGGGVPSLAQCSAHGPTRPCTVTGGGDRLEIAFAEPSARIAPGQTVALYDPERPERVVGSGVVG
ncbi:MAG TPA: aminomethyltransferase beta-barrel domain-containing protein, partial [Acidimicrobiales bacterium]|nr:aminomethyltransferase beta-barrel domain-containing protein [Acidimicrobiales bacterium]